MFDRIECVQTPISLGTNEFEITEVYRFEGISDQADEAIVFDIESKHDLKGLLVNGYGTSADSISDVKIKKLAVTHGEV